MELNYTDEACPHSWDESVMRHPLPSVIVHRDECAYCCRTCAPKYDGIYVCMACFAGLCGEHVAKHMALQPTHAMYTCIHELPDVKSSEEEEVKDVYKLGVAKPKEYESFLCCGECKVRFNALPELAVNSYTGVLNAPVPGVQDHAAAEGNLIFMKPKCTHLVCLEQVTSPYTANKPPTSENVCSTEGCVCCLNNWMCITCGAIGCPREESGGHGHALKHFEETGHPAAVKLGTITPTEADIYCYSCDDDVADTHFRDHMAHFGIDIDTSRKTAKTMGEMQYDYSTQYDFNKITEAGSDLVPVSGPGRTGIRNIGNSCYVASVVQCLMSLEPYQRAFYPQHRAEHQAKCTDDPYDCRTCQTERMAAGLLSGDFSKPGEAQDGVPPRQFKRVYAQKHPEFSTSQQQDAQEYFLYLLDEMRRFAKPAGVLTGADGKPIHPSDLFTMTMEQRIQCSKCQRVRYSHSKESCLSLPIPVDPSAAAAVPTEGAALTDEELDQLRPRCSLAHCLEALVLPNAIDCRCEACGEAAVYVSTTKLSSFPEVLPVYLRRTYFDTQALTTKKMDVYVEVPQALDLSAFRATGKGEGEVQMPRASALPGGSKGGKTEVAVDEVALVTVVSMGIDTAVAMHALRQTDMNVERAVDYIFCHPEIESEMAAAAGCAEGEERGAPADDMSQRPKAAPTDGASTYTLAAMISHIGTSAKVGHYVCHIKDKGSGKWLLFNDEKVGESQNPPFAMSSLLFYQRSV